MDKSRLLLPPAAALASQPSRESAVVAKTDAPWWANRRKEPAATAAHSVLCRLPTSPGEEVEVEGHNTVLFEHVGLMIHHGKTSSK